ncbi:MAG: helicase C-terminal domain-containing protein [Armatimonadota bacterium]|nr:DEAD/DEAH box helicase [Armatimonadota bacterium]MCX7776788.1 DEAD/DEAH box helicase [Armatimonadota bacterium]MDW8024585.1 helicase C-terminal domain-containing protein [Armatimonadota bacterium]
MGWLVEQSLSILGRDGVIARSLDGYEMRLGQLQMCEAVAKAIEDCRHLLVEAGTGIGKTFAYLVPAALWVSYEGKRVIVSTYTKTLQQQLVEKDLPFLHEVLGGLFRYAVAYGSQNYICLRRLESARRHGILASVEEMAQLEFIAEWAKQTATGLRMELDFEPSAFVWDAVSRDPDLCIGKQCHIFSQCPYQRSRRQLSNAHIIVVNHHLFFANITTDGYALPVYDAVVFDEAHNLEEVACDYLTQEVSNTTLETLLSHIIGRRSERGRLLKHERTHPDLFERIHRAVEDVRINAELFFRDVRNWVGESQTLRIRERRFVEDRLSQPLIELAFELRGFAERLSEPDERAEFEIICERLVRTHSLLQNILEMSFDGYVYWAQVEQLRRETKVSLCMAPIELSDMLKESVFVRGMPIIFTSATLATSNSFTYIRERLGIEDADELMVESPFNFKEQVLLYLSDDLPDPSVDLQAFTHKAAERTIELLRITDGATFVLFTSYPAMRYTGERIRAALPHLNLFVQGEMPRGRMLEKFRVTDRAVLLGTNTFWQGVDIPGEALIAVIIVKLPFAVPDDPITEARIEKLREEGKDAFYSYQLPQAIIWLKQGFGRLVRRTDDYGIVAILDPRVITRGYGKQFLRSLPRCKVTTSLEDVRSFLMTKAFKRAANGFAGAIASS